jgi:hypothetical protein
MYDQYDRNNQPHLQDLALQIDNVCVLPPHPSSSLTVESSMHGDEDVELMGLGQELDPLGERILSAAKNLLAETDRITIKDLAEVTGLGDAALRRRMIHIVDLHQLGCIPGSGRSPSQYYLLTECDRPETPKMIDAVLGDEKILEKIKQREVSLLEELDSLQQDRAALEKAISVRRKYLA